MSLITEEQVVLDLTGADRHEATRRLGERLVASGRCTDLDTFLDDVRKREETMATGLPGGIGIPHARSAAITEPSLVFGRSPTASTGAPRTARPPWSSSSRPPRVAATRTCRCCPSSPALS